MSYDLYFEAGKGRTLEKKSFAAYFRGRRNYQVGKGQALYQNEDTGVYFIFDEPDDGIVAMNLNLFRPHTFALESAREIEAFAGAFAAEVTDPQGEADGAQPFDRAAFLRSYDQANEFAYRSMLPEMEPVHTWPTRRIREVWEWNDTRPGDEEQADGLPRYRLDNEPAFPPEVAAFLHTKRKPVGKLNGVGFDEILDREVVDAVRKG